MQIGCPIRDVMGEQNFHLSKFIKGYCTSSWINCCMAKWLAQALASSGLRQWFGHTTFNTWRSAITLLLLCNLYTKTTPGTYTMWSLYTGGLYSRFDCIYLVPHFRDVLGNFMCYIRPDKAPENRILAVVGCRKWSENLRNHAYSYSNGSMAFVLLAYHWITTINASACNSTVRFTN